MTANRHCPFILRALKERDSVSIRRIDPRGICRVAGAQAIWGYQIWAARVQSEGAKIIGSAILYPNIGDPVVTKFVAWPEGLTREDIIQAILDNPDADEIQSVPSRGAMKPIHVEASGDRHGQITARFPGGERLVFGLNDNAMIIQDSMSDFKTSRQGMIEWLRREHPYAIVVCGVRNPGDWSELRDLGYVRRLETKIFDGRYTPMYSSVNHEALKTLLLKSGCNPLIGPEVRAILSENIELMESRDGSYRYIFQENGEILSGIQVMSRDGQNGVLVNAFTAPEARRRGLASKLIEAAKSRFSSLEYSEERSIDGAALVESLEDSEAKAEVGLHHNNFSRPRL